MERRLSRRYGGKSTTNVVTIAIGVFACIVVSLLALGSMSVFGSNGEGKADYLGAVQSVPNRAPGNSNDARIDGPHENNNAREYYDDFPSLGESYWEKVEQELLELAEEREEDALEYEIIEELEQGIGGLEDGIELLEEIDSEIREGFLEGLDEDEIELLEEIEDEVEVILQAPRNRKHSKPSGTPGTLFRTPTSPKDYLFKQLSILLEMPHRCVSDTNPFYVNYVKNDIKAIVDAMMAFVQRFHLPDSTWESRKELMRQYMEEIGVNGLIESLISVGDDPRPSWYNSEYIQRHDEWKAFYTLSSADLLYIGEILYELSEGDVESVSEVVSMDIYGQNGNEVLTALFARHSRFLMMNTDLSQIDSSILLQLSNDLCGDQEDSSFSIWSNCVKTVSRSFFSLLGNPSSISVQHYCDIGDDLDWSYACATGLFSKLKKGMSLTEKCSSVAFPATCFSATVESTESCFSLKDSYAIMGCMWSTRNTISVENTNWDRYPSGMHSSCDGILDSFKGHPAQYDYYAACLQGIWRLLLGELDRDTLLELFSWDNCEVFSSLKDDRLQDECLAFSTYPREEACKYPTELLEKYRE